MDQLQYTSRHEQDEFYMTLALASARAAGELGEIPIGAVVVCNQEVISSAGNQRENDDDPAGHAEFLAIRAAAKQLKRWRLSDCTVYVTLEPCLMCAGLMQLSRIYRCVYGAADLKAGALGSLYEVHMDQRLNHNFAVTSGVLAEECSSLLREFFSQQRNK